MQQYKKGQIIKEVEKELKIDKCPHRNLVPLEFRFAKLVYENGYKNPPRYDWSTGAIGAQVLRVKSYLCLNCGEEIPAPKRKNL